MPLNKPLPNGEIEPIPAFGPFGISKVFTSISAFSGVVISTYEPVWCKTIAVPPALNEPMNCAYPSPAAVGGMHLSFVPRRTQ